MGNFAKSHSLSTFEARKKARAMTHNTAKREKWLRADHIVDQVYCDLCNGKSKSECLLKLTSGQYDGQERPIKERTAYDYIASAVDRLHYDMEAQMEDIRADLYGKLLTVYNDAMMNNDRYSAIGALSTMMKLVGADKSQQTNIQINNNTDGVTINFGFKKEEETDGD